MLYGFKVTIGNQQIFILISSKNISTFHMFSIEWVHVGVCQTLVISVSELVILVER